MVRVQHPQAAALFVVCQTISAEDRHAKFYSEFCFSHSLSQISADFTTGPTVWFVHRSHLL